MALLINKLFSSKKKIYSKHTDVGDRAFSFSKEQVRVVLFRECDFRGRKLLFDSQTVQKVPITPISKTTIGASDLNSQCNSKNDIFVEISNGYGYQYSRPSNDTVILGETVFGSVAMSYQGTSFKIHSFSSPPKLMCTQVFPSPKVRIRSRVSVPNNTSPLPPSNSSGVIVERSGKFEYSSASSTSFSDIMFGRSTDSDIKNVSNGGSVPLDVPLISGDSGFCGELSYNSMSSGNHSLTLLDARLEHMNMPSFSCGSLYKRWFRSASTSLDHSCSDVSMSATGSHNSASADDCLMRNQHRSSKLGLAIILQLTENKESEMESFLLKHAALIEAMVCRARSGAETAYTKPGVFASLMCDIHQEICQYLYDLLTSNTLDVYLWHEIGSKPIPTQPKTNFFTNTLFNFTKTRSESNLVKFSEVNRRTKIDSLNSDNVSFKINVNNSFSGLDKGEGEKCDNRWQCIDSFKRYHSSHFADTFVKELCELLELVEAKQTNFFISTLLTAVLTHHLGWVSTVCPPTKKDKDAISKMQSPCNPLWGQLSDLYGAVGHPTKMSRTIVCGSNKGDLIEKILNMLTYFIRCSAVQKNNLGNFHICDLNLNSVEDNEAKNIPLQQNNICDSTISENCNKVLQNQKNIDNNTEQLEMKTLKIPNLNVKNEKLDVPSKIPNNTDIKSHSNSSIEKSSNLKPSGLKSMKKSTSYVGNLCLQSGYISNHFSSENKKNLGKMDEEDKVVFVLGENDELRGLKKNSNSRNNIECLPKNNISLSDESALDCNENKDCRTLNINTESENCKLYFPKDNDSSKVKSSAKENDYLKNENTCLLCDNKLCFSKEKELVKVNYLDKNDDLRCVKTIDVKPTFSLDDDALQSEMVFDFSKNKVKESKKNSGTEKCLPLCKIEESKSCKKHENEDNKPCFSKENDTLNIPTSSKVNRPTDLKLPNKTIFSFSDSSPDSPSSNCLCAEVSPCSECEKVRKRSSSLQPSDIINNKLVLTRASKIALENDFDSDATIEHKRREGFDRSQSVPPSDKKRKCSKAGCRKKYAGVKFDMRQYPQIVTNYMKSKDLELSQLPFGEKSLKLNRSFSTILYDNCVKDFPSCDCEHDTEALTTPSNASELEFSSDLESDKYEFLGTKQTSVDSNFDEEIPETSGKNAKSSVVVVEHPLLEDGNKALFEHDDYCDKKDRISKMVYSEFPVPSIDVESLSKNDASVGYTHTLLRGINNNYISDMVLQGTTSPPSSWEHVLKRDLRLTARQPPLDQPIQEAVAIVANTDTWEVQLISSHSYVVERGCAGVRICLSQLVANMLESLLLMWKLRTPTEYCLMHIEAKLREFCLHSNTMAQILMNTDFCNMDMLTSALQLEVNDIPLLMAVASTHTPQVTQKYGLSFQ